MSGQVGTVIVLGGPTGAGARRKRDATSVLGGDARLSTRHANCLAAAEVGVVVPSTAAFSTSLRTERGTERPADRVAAYATSQPRPGSGDTPRPPHSRAHRRPGPADDDVTVFLRGNGP
jgi:hypothetical protein